MLKYAIVLTICISWTGVVTLFAQNAYWQQRVEYSMEVSLDVTTHRYTGDQRIVYYNRSPDTLTQVFYHLYFNAFQPGSMMDVRSRTIQDPDRRVMDRISKLKENEVGYLKIKNFQQDEAECTFVTEGTILEVELAQPLLPGEQTTLALQFEGQVPVQIRRSGRNNREGIAYSMAQWYPKLCEYDYMGWHANPYVGREFYGVWGDFDVKLTLDSSYVVAATGYLQNPEEIGHGYPTDGKKVKRPKSDQLTWHFQAPNVHDFMWAADPDYIHDIAQVPDGPALHFFYQGEMSSVVDNWKNLQPQAVRAFQYMNRRFGKYPYKKYSIIQGGDGGMEYPMGTLINGNGQVLGVTIHEAMHSWYQMVLGTNESLYPWMDEGFTSYATSEVFSFLRNGESGGRRSHAGSYRGYVNLVQSGQEEPSSMHSDHYHTNGAYGTAAYSKGAVFLHQLSYIIGQEALDRGLLRYFDTWKFKHPTPNDFKRVMEKESGIELDWYLEYWINTTRSIDYRIRKVSSNDDNIQVELERVGKMPMPIELEVTFRDGRVQTHYIPLRIMRGQKAPESEESDWLISPDWPWTHPTYTVEFTGDIANIESIEIDPSQRLADIDRSNNRVEMEEDQRFYVEP